MTEVLNELEAYLTFVSTNDPAFWEKLFNHDFDNNHEMKRNRPEWINSLKNQPNNVIIGILKNKSLEDLERFVTFVNALIPRGFDASFKNGATYRANYWQNRHPIKPVALTAASFNLLNAFSSALRFGRVAYSF